MKLKIEHKDREIEFNLSRRKRKTIGIKIDEAGDITVSAPLKVSADYILQVVRNKAYWIVEKQKEMQFRSSKKVKRDFTEGSTFMYLGEEYPINIKVQLGRKKIVVKFNDMFDVYTNEIDYEKIKVALEKWYRDETFKIVTERINYYANNFKDRVSGIKVKEQKRRWASCTGKNTILFNWRISMARADVIDYIVVHEMCHMDHRDHSKYFWIRVAEIMPDYKEKHEWLKQNGVNLYL